jgi:hypothetical protein
MYITDKQQLLNIIANELEMYEFGRDVIYPVEIVEHSGIEIVVYRRKGVLRAMDYASFVKNVRLKAVFG